jgi:hypothetical protein
VAEDDRECHLETQRLEAQIMHLKGQLTLAQATVEAKNATIELQRDRLIYQGQLLESRLLPGPNPLEKPEAERESILDGMVEIKKYEGKGFNVNLPKLFRGLRAVFKRDKHKDDGRTG